MIRPFLSILILSVSCTLTVADPTGFYAWNLKPDRLAVQGHDVVAYFSLSSNKDAVRGKREFSYEWENAIWKFSSERNLNMFKTNPEKYIPQYGGHCAYAAARNYLYFINPDAWTIQDGKLYLNASKGVRSSWLEDINNEIKRANKNWPTLKQNK